MKRKEEALIELLSDNRELLQAECISKLFAKAPDIDEEVVREQFNLLALDFHEKYYSAVMLSFEPIPEEKHGSDYYFGAFRKMLETTFISNGFQIFSFWRDVNTLLCLIGWSVGNDVCRIEALLSGLIEKSNYIIHIGVTVSIGKAVTRLSDLYKSAEYEQMPFNNNRQHIESKNLLITSAKEYISQNLGKQGLSLDDVSDYVGLSRNYFCQLFHKEEGISFVNYLNRERLSRARALLKTTNLKVFEISDNVGFNNVKHFNYLFKQYTGITPLEYRNR